MGVGVVLHFGWWGAVCSAIRHQQGGRGLVSDCAVFERRHSARPVVTVAQMFEPIVDSLYVLWRGIVCLVCRCVCGNALPVIIHEALRVR